MSVKTINPNNVSVGKPMAAGGVFCAPQTVQLPTDATTKLDTQFTGLGYVSKDGLANSVETDTEQIKAWGGDTVLTVATSRTETFTFTLIESLSEAVLKQIYGEKNVASGKIVHNGLPRGRWIYVFEILLTGGKIKRIVVPNAEITETGEVTYKDGDPIGYEVTLSCYPDKDGNTAYEYIAAITEREE